MLLVKLLIDDKYIYLSNEIWLSREAKEKTPKTLYVIEKDGNSVVNIIRDDNIFRTMFGGGDRLFFIMKDNSIGYIPKDNFGKENKCEVINFD